MEYKSAEEGCGTKGGHLASVASNKELDFLQSFIASYHQCGNDWWTLDPVAKKCFYFSHDSLSWFDALSSCMESDSQLVVIDSNEKNHKFISFSNS